jgi:hypothetical protein
MEIFSITYVVKTSQDKLIKQTNKEVIGLSSNRTDQQKTMPQTDSPTTQTTVRSLKQTTKVKARESATCSTSRVITPHANVQAD